MARLLVFLHGLYVTHEQGLEVQLALPRIPGHVYRAGNWLTETNIERGRTLRLRGFSAGQASLATADKMVQLPGLTLTGRGLAAMIRVPRPDQILPFCIAKKPDPSVFVPAAPQKLLGPDIVSRNDDPQKGWSEIGGVHVFVYEGVDENAIELAGHYWEPYKIDDAISLHLISTSPVNEGQYHQELTEDLLTTVLNGYPKLTFERFTFHEDWRTTPVFPYQDATGRGFPEDAVVDGQNKFVFSRAELERFPVRCARLNRLGRIKKDGRPPNLLWHEIQPISSSADNCGPINI